MWRALRTELAYSRPYVLGGLGLALGVAALVSGIFAFVGEEAPPSHAAAGIRGMFVIMAPLIVGFIAQAYRAEERRARLFLAGPLTPRHVALVSVLLPVVLGGIAVAAAGLMIAGEALATGRFSIETLHLVGYVGGMIFVGLMVGLLIQEATAAYREQRMRAAVAGWAGLGIAVLLVYVPTVAAVFVQGPRTWPTMHLGNLLGALVTMAAAVALGSSRTDFTR